MTEPGGAKPPCDWTSEEFVAELARASYAARLGASPRTQSQRAFALYTQEKHALSSPPKSSNNTPYAHSLPSGPYFIFSIFIHTPLASRKPFCAGENGAKLLGNHWQF